MSVFVSAFSFDAEGFVDAVDHAALVGGDLDAGRLRRLAEQALTAPSPVVVDYLAALGGDVADRQWWGETFPAGSPEPPGDNPVWRADWWVLAMAPWLEATVQAPANLALLLGPDLRGVGWTEHSIKRLVGGDPLATLLARSRSRAGIEGLDGYGGWLAAESVPGVLAELEAAPLQQPGRGLAQAWAEALRMAVNDGRSLRIVRW